MVEVQDECVTFTAPPGAACLIGDFSDWDERPIPISTPVTLEFPQGAYVEYAFLDTEGTMLADPMNTCTPRNGWYEEHRYVALPGCSYTTPLRSQELNGTVRRHERYSNALGEHRTYHVYEPATRPSATMYVHDGDAFLRKLRLHEVVDSLTKQECIHPIRVVFIVPQDREREYWFNERYERFVLDELIPAVESQYGVSPERALWGASLGGMVSAWLALRNPHIFARVASQSGCFTAHPQGTNYYRDPEWLTTQFTDSAPQPLRFYVETGQIEWLLAPNRRFAAMLVDKGYPHRYREWPGGHNWTTWEQGLEPGLKYLFALPPTRRNQGGAWPHVTPDTIRGAVPPVPATWLI